MKKVLLATLATSLIASHSFAYEPINTTDYAKLAEQFKKMNMSKLISNKKLEDVVLFDGRTINIKQDVDSLNLYNNKIDYLELRSGEIVDRLDIHQLQINLGGRVQRLMATGVDGGG